MSRIGGTSFIDLGYMGDHLARGWQLAQGDQSLAQQRRALDLRAADQAFGQQMELDQVRREAERYADTKAATSSFYQAIRDELEAEQAGVDATAGYGAMPNAAPAVQGPTGPRPQQFGGAFPDVAINAPFTQTPNLVSAPGPQAVQPVYRTPTPEERQRQNAQASFMRWPTGVQDAAREAIQGAGQGPAIGDMGDVGTVANQFGQPPTPQAPQGMPSPARRLPLGQRVMGRLTPEHISMLPPTQQRFLEDLLSDDMGTLRQLANEKTKIQHLLSGDMFRFFVGGSAPDPQNPEAFNQQIDTLVDQLDAMVKLGMINEGELFRNAHPRVREAMMARQNAEIENSLKYLETEMLPDGTTRIIPGTRATFAGYGPKLLETAVQKKYAMDLENRAKWQAEQQALAGAAAQLGISIEEARTLGPSGVRQLAVDRMSERPSTGPEFEQDVTDFMRLHPESSRGSAEAYIRQRNRKFANQEPANISGRRTGGKASTVLIDGPKGEQRVIQGNGEIIRWHPGNQWAAHYRSQAEAVLKSESGADDDGGFNNPPGTKWFGNSDARKAWEARKQARIEDTAKSMARGAGFVIDGEDDVGVAPTMAASRSTQSAPPVGLTSGRLGPDGEEIDDAPRAPQAAVPQPDARMQAKQSLLQTFQSQTGQTYDPRNPEHKAALRQIEQQLLSAAPR